MIDQRTVWSAERAVAARKATIAAQWTALRARVRDGITQPTTIGAMALVGGVIGWRSAAPKKTVEAKCECPEKSRPSILGGGMRALAIATLQAAAAIASEEFLRSISEQKRHDDGTDESRTTL